MEEVRDIPAGLLTCLADQNEVTIEQISSEALWIRTAEPLLFVEKNIVFELIAYEAGFDSYKKVKITNYKGEDYGSSKFFYQYKIIVQDNTEYEQTVQMVVNEYYHYIQQRYEGLENVFPVGPSVTGYQAELDEKFYSDYESQKDSWLQMKENHQLTLRQKVLQMIDENKGQIELAVCLQDKKQYQEFLLKDFLDKCKESKQELWTASTRLYIGNAFCHHLLPEEPLLEKMIYKTILLGKAVTIVLPYLRDSQIEEMDSFLTNLYLYMKNIANKQRREKEDSCTGVNVEVVINDWGYLGMLEDKQDIFTPVLGTMLNRRRKDPRIQYIRDFQMEDKYGENQLNSKKFQSYLGRYGITRYEYESCGYPQTIAQGYHSMHLPLYQTNTSQLCPLRAMVRYGDRGHQIPVKQCSYDCMNYAVAYPKHLQMAGRFNSLFGFDHTLLEENMLETYTSHGIDRIVWNL